MAQKVNSLSLRLNKRLNWNTILCTHSFNDYCNQIVNNSTILEISKNILYDLKILQNNTSLTKTSKGFSVNCKILDQQLFFYLVKFLCSTKKTSHLFNSYYQAYINILKSINKKLILNHKSILQQFTTIKTQKQIIKQKKFKSNFLSLYPVIFTLFTKIQLSVLEPNNLVYNVFGKNLQKSLLNLIEIFLRLFKYQIIGIKLICSGKWKKTNSGRKQKIYLKFGQVQSSNLATKILYNHATQKTKFGICSIKIWIAHKI